MDLLLRVPKSDLARHTRQIIRNVQRGQTILVENHGQAEAAILDIADYHILRAVASYYTHPPQVADEGLSDETLHSLSRPQEAYDLVLAHYLTGVISLGRAAELLDLPWLDLRTRFIRLDVPLSLGNSSEQEAEAEVAAARNF